MESITPLFHRIACSFFLAVAIGKAPQAQSQTPGEQLSLRESCRQQVAGIYLSNHDENQKSKEMIQHMGNQITQLKQALQDTQATRSQIMQAFAQDTYDLSLNYKLRGMDSKIETIEHALTEAEQMRQTYKNQQVTTHHREEFLKTHLMKVFQFNQIKGKGYGYKTRVDYIESCPKYRKTCPLSANGAQALRNLDHPQFALPLECQRYSTYLQKTHH